METALVGLSKGKTWGKKTSVLRQLMVLLGIHKLITLQKDLTAENTTVLWLHGASHTSLPVHPLWLAAIFAKLPSVLSPAFLPLLTHVSHCCHLSLSWAGSSSTTRSCFAFHPTPPSSPSWALPWELFAFWKMDFQFIIDRLLLLIHNHVPNVLFFFFFTEASFAAAFVLQAPASSLLICLSSSPCSVSTLSGLWLCLLPAAFLSSHKGEGRYTCEASIVSKNRLPLWPEV